MKFHLGTVLNACPRKTTNQPSVTGGVIIVCSVADKHSQEALSTNKLRRWSVNWSLLIHNRERVKTANGRSVKAACMLREVNMITQSDHSTTQVALIWLTARHCGMLDKSLTDSTVHVQGFKIFHYLLQFVPFSNALKYWTLHLLSQVVFWCSPLGNCKLGYVCKYALLFVPMQK